MSHSGPTHSRPAPQWRRIAWATAWLASLASPALAIAPKLSNYKGFPTQASNTHPGSIANQWTQALVLWFSDQIGRLLRWAGR